MSKYDNLPFHPTTEKVVNILRKKTQNENPVFFRLVVSYFFSKIASMMRVHVQLGDSQQLPVNMYAMNLAPSGSGKGHSVAIIEEEIIGAFRTRFLEYTFPEMAKKRIATLAIQRANRNGTDDSKELDLATMEFEEQGVLLFSFDSGTSAAIKQMRTKLLMAGAGSMNLEMDEIGSNFTGNQEVLNNYLELFDTGKIKQKLIKNTRENIRSEDLFGATPTNMLLFGTPTKLLNGSKEEDQFYEMLETGYARRCFFGYSRFRKPTKNMTPQAMYDLYHDVTTSKYLMQLSDRLQMLAEPATFNQILKPKHDVLLALYEYQIWCQEESAKLSEFEEVRKAEITHRYFKVIKLAATYAYIDKSIWVEMHHLHNAIAMAQESGEGFKRILNRDRPYVKLANYIVSVGKELTHADLTEDLPFYKGSEQNKREMLNLAIAHGYKQGMYIRKEISDGIEFFSGDRVPETNIDEIIISYSKRITEGYKNEVVAFNKLDQLVGINGYHWVNHALRGGDTPKGGYRDEEHCIAGVNMIVLDVEHSVTLDTAKMLLNDYTWLIHTTKRHTDKEHRYRILLPISHEVRLDAKEFKEFMQNIFDWLPFEVDTQTGQRSRKWMTCKGKFWYNSGQLIDTLQFIPKTKKADERKQIIASQTNFSNLERWFINNTVSGNRNNQMRNFAFMLVDMGQDTDSIRSKVMTLNSKLDNPLDESEISATIMTSVSKRVYIKGESD